MTTATNTTDRELIDAAIAEGKVTKAKPGKARGVNKRTAPMTTTRKTKAQRKHYRLMLEENSNNPDSFWKSIKKVFPTRGDKSTATMCRIDGDRVTDKRKIANAFVSFYSTVACKLRKSILT